MNSTLTNAVEVDSLAIDLNSEVIEELSNVDLVLVGGGIGAVTFF
jgi:hypothetical protein